MKNTHKKLLLQERLELSTSAYLSLEILGEGTDYKYGALTDCATGAASLYIEVTIIQRRILCCFLNFHSNISINAFMQNLTKFSIIEF